MRLLIACPKCNRQYEAKQKRLGSRFRCHCGEVLTLRPPEGHDARVVNCSSCGAPQEEGRTSCNFCGTDFTLHERDLNTICPKCMARISDRARFCHRCGTRVAPESLAGEETKLVCPACGGSHYLSGRQVADLPVLECGRCAGLWLGNDAFQQATEKASANALDVDVHFTPRQAAAGDPELSAKDTRYRKCPTCGNIMYRRNYARRSGVILDICREHGAWFDADELPRIINWIRAGGLARSKRELANDETHQERLQKVERATQRSTAWMHEDRHASQFGLAEVLVETVFRFFGP
jgi:Zn-finger nucleic acid-binding protein